MQGTPDATEETPQDFKVAFFADQGLGTEAEDVLKLVKSEGAELVVHSGDFEYKSSPDAWEKQIDDILGADFPYFASIGNHDEDAWGGSNGYQSKIYDRMRRVNVTTCSGEVGVNEVCSYKGLVFVLSGAGTKGTNHARFIEESFGVHGGIWRFCSWHKNMKKMQTGSKTDETGWDVYEKCREMGAFIATGHEHEYSRTKLLSNFQKQTIANQTDIVMRPGVSFAFVSGVGGYGVRDAIQSLHSPYWATALDAKAGLRSGALFCEFNKHNESRAAYCYFKQIDGSIRDQFNMTSENTVEGPGVPPLKLQPVGILIAAVVVAGAIILCLSFFTIYAWRRHRFNEKAYDNVDKPHKNVDKMSRHAQNPA